MHIFFNILKYLFLSLLVFNGAFAMKRNGDEFERNSKKFKSELVAEEQIEIYLPVDMIVYIFKFLNLGDLHASFINREWLEGAKLAFPDFYKFQDTYHECQGIINLRDLKITYEILKKIRASEAVLTKHCSIQEKIELSQAFLKNNYNSILEMAKTPQFLLEAGFKKYPKTWMQLALLRIWDTVPRIPNSPIISYEAPCLNILAPNEDLNELFRKAENDLETWCAFASELCERGPAYIQVVILKAGESYAIGLYDKYLKLFEIAFNKDPHLPAGIIADAGYAYFHLRNWKKAAELYEIAIDKNPNLFADVFTNAGHVYVQLQNWKRAADLYQIAIDKNPNLFAGVFVSAGYAYFQLQNWKRAAELFEIALNKDSNLFAYVFADAECAYFQLQNWEKVTELYEIAIKKDLNLSAGILANAGFAYFCLQNWKKATELYEIAINKDLNLDSLIFHNTARAYIRLQNFQRAAEIYEIGIKNNKCTSAIFYLLAGWTNVKLDKLEVAASYFKQFIDRFDEAPMAPIAKSNFDMIQTTFEKENVDEKYREWVKEKLRSFN